jgi:hypothetical protein
MITKLFTLLLPTVLLTSCAVRVADCTIVSTKNVDFNRLAKAKLGQTRVKGEDCKIIILVIPAGVPNLKSAIDKAIETVPGCIALADVAVYQKSFYVPFLIGTFGYAIEGTPIIDSTPSSTASYPQVLKIDMHDQSVQSIVLSKEQLHQLREQFN